MKKIASVESDISKQSGVLTSNFSISTKTPSQIYTIKKIYFYSNFLR